MTRQEKIKQLVAPGMAMLRQTERECSAALPEPEPNLSEQVELLQKTVDALRERMGNLSTKLSPICRPTIISGESLMKENPDPGSAMACRLRSITRDVWDISAHVDSLVGSVDL